MEIDEPDIDAAALPPVAADAVAAAADLLQISAAAAAITGQLRADLTTAPSSSQAQTILILCSYVWRIAVCRCPAGLYGSAFTGGRRSKACLRALRPPVEQSEASSPLWLWPRMRSSL